MRLLFELISRFRLPTLLLLTLCLAFTGLLDRLIGLDHIEETGSAFIHDSMVRTEESFLLVSGVLSGLELLNSSSTGFSLGLEMDIQVGEMIHHLMKMVDYIWQWLVVSGATLALMEILLGLSLVLASWLLPWVLGLVLFLAVLGVLIQPEHMFGLMVKKMVCLVFILWLGLAYAFPLCVFVVAKVSEEVTGPLARESHAGMQDALKGYHIDQSVSEKEEKHHESRVKWAKEQVKQMKAFKAEESKGLFHHIRIMVMSAVVEMVVVPLLFLISFWVLSRLLLRHLELNHWRGKSEAMMLQEGSSGR